MSRTTTIYKEIILPEKGPAIYSNDTLIFGEISSMKNAADKRW
jgi:hypothetical protein